MICQNPILQKNKNSDGILEIVRKLFNKKYDNTFLKKYL